MRIYQVGKLIHYTIMRYEMLMGSQNEHFPTSIN